MNIAIHYWNIIIFHAKRKDYAMKKTFIFLVSAMAFSMALCGCTLFNGGIWPSTEIEVRRAMVPVEIDGKVTDEIWERSKFYPFSIPNDPDRLREWRNNRPYQEGTVQIAYDDKYVYVLAKLEDDDIVQYGENGTHLYQRGDTFEFFLQNPVSGHYWEIYGSANGKSTVMFFENGGKRIFPEAIQKNDKIKVAVDVKGTLNNSKDTDKYFVVEMAIPMSIINSKGDFFKPGTSWNVLCARYNYSKSLFDLELTSTSAAMPKANWHDRKSYLPIVFR